MEHILRSIIYFYFFCEAPAKHPRCGQGIERSCASGLSPAPVPRRDGDRFGGHLLFLVRHPSLLSAPLRSVSREIALWRNSEWEIRVSLPHCDGSRLVGNSWRTVAHYGRICWGIRLSLSYYDDSLDSKTGFALWRNSEWGL